MTEPGGATCVRCGAPLPPGAPAGLCPGCRPPDTPSDQTETTSGHAQTDGGARHSR
jgi:hypothetical protein